MSSELYNYPPKFENLPQANLGNLNGPEGNAFMVAANVSQALKSHGYTLEASEISKIMTLQKSYENVLEAFSHFVDITPKEEVLDYDDEYIYLKVKRTDNVQDKKNSIPTKLYSTEQLEDLIDEGFDINEKNVFGRNILFYNQNATILHALHTHGIDLFIKDNFNASPLLFLDLPILSEYVQLVMAEDKVKTIEYVNNKDQWGRELINHIFAQLKDSKGSYHKTLNNEIQNFLHLLYDNSLLTNGSQDVISDIKYSLNLFNQKSIDKDLFKKMIVLSLGNNPQNITNVLEHFSHDSKMASLMETIKLESIIQDNNKTSHTLKI
jgi:hypothetical protein